MKTYQEKIIEFMRLKQKYLLSKSIKSAKDYLTESDSQKILKWSNEDAKRVWEVITYNIQVKSSGLRSDSCPFCIYHYNNCRVCTYNSKCDNSDSTYSMIKKEISKKIEISPISDFHLLPNKVYVKILNKIEKSFFERLFKKVKVF